jgi:hypothetical protein
MGSRHDRGVAAPESPRCSGDAIIENIASGSVCKAAAEIEDARPPHPALGRLSAVLGREAAAFTRRYRYAGLGLIQLILSRKGGRLDD